MKKLLMFLAIIALSMPILAGCGGGGGSSSGGGYSYVPYYYYANQQNNNNQPNNNNNNQPNNNNNNNQPNNNNNNTNPNVNPNINPIINPTNNDTSDSTAPETSTKSNIVIASGVYSKSIFSIVGSGFGYTQSSGDVTLTLESGTNQEGVTYFIQKWNNDSINIQLNGLSSPYSAVYSSKIKTASGAEIAGPNIEVIPNAIDNNIGTKAYAIFVGSPATSIGPYCVKDATAVHNALVNNPCFVWSNSQLLTNENDVSRSNIANIWAQMANEMDDNSTFIFYYSGHGANNYLAVSGGLTASDIETLLKKMPENAHKILLIDACSSGSFLPKNLKKSKKTFKSLASSIKNLAVISACGPENDSSVSTKLDQSEMTYAFLQAVGKNNSSAGIQYMGAGLTLSEVYNSMAEQNFYTSASDNYGTQIIFPTFKKTGNDCYIKQ